MVDGLVLVVDFDGLSAASSGRRSQTERRQAVEQRRDTPARYRSRVVSDRSVATGSADGRSHTETRRYDVGVVATATATAR